MNNAQFIIGIPPGGEAAAGRILRSIGAKDKQKDIGVLLPDFRRKQQ